MHRAETHPRSHVDLPSSKNPPSKSAKDNSLLFVALNILWIGGLVVAAVGMSAIGANQNWWTAKSLEALTNVKAIIMITIGGASALVGILWISIKKSSCRPAPMKPTSTEPSSNESTTTKSASTKPVPMKPTSMESAPTRPVPMKPTSTEPSSKESTSMESAPTRPVPMKPTSTEPSSKESTTTEPAPIKPVPMKHNLGDPQKIDLPVFFEDLKTKILTTPKYVTAPAPSSDLLSDEELSDNIHAHEVLPHVYLGDYKAFLSVDPKFLEKHDIADPLALLFNCYPPTERQTEWAQKHLDYTGCSNKNIKRMISLTKFKPADYEPENSWLRFDPDLKELGIQRLQIAVAHEDADAWETIEPHLDEIFRQIDEAIFYKQNILVYCFKGDSRSASVICAYLMDRCGVTLDQALNYVKCIRHQVKLPASFRKPNFKKGIEAYEADLKALRDKTQIK